MNTEDKKSCRICFGKFTPEIFIGRELWTFSSDRFEYLKCSACGCIQLKEYPANIADYYSSEYYSFNSNRKISKIVKRLTGIRDNYALTGIGTIGKILYTIWPTTLFKNIPYPQVSKSSKILDVGCGDGSFLNTLYQLGFDKLTGIDLFLNNEVFLDGKLQLLKADIYKINEIFDCIILKGTLEHQPNQLNLLKKIGSLLLPGGLVVIRIPVVDSYAWEHYRENWTQFDAPRHFYLHSVKSIELLARQANFSIEHKDYDSGIFQFIGSEQIARGIALHDSKSYFVNRKKSIFTRLKIKEFRRRAKSLDSEKRGDVMIFTLRKKMTSNENLHNSITFLKVSPALENAGHETV